MWLLKKLAPDFKTIADFKATALVYREFVQICHRLSFFNDHFVAIDGSRFKAVNSRSNNFTKAKIKIHIERHEKKIQKYLKEKESADRKYTQSSKQKIMRLETVISDFKEKITKLNDRLLELHNTKNQQISLIDPDARSMSTNRSGKGIMSSHLLILNITLLSLMK